MNVITTIVLMGLIALVAAVIVMAFCLMQKRPQPSLTTTATAAAAKQPLPNPIDPCAQILLIHEEKMRAFECWVDENRPWATERSTHAQHLLLAAAGALELYCYRMRSLGKIDEYHEARLATIIGLIEPSINFSDMPQQADEEE